MRGRPTLRVLMLAALCWIAAPGRAAAQLGALVSPGPLARAHAALEGADNCQKCHERGRKVTPEKCLTCHAPIAQRVALKKGIHRNAGTDCVTCHVDHAGVDGELRPFDRAKFNHAIDAGYAIDGRHAPLAANCASCHKTRSFLTLSPACSTCHTDAHKGSLGTSCERCHSTAAAFMSATNGFDHGATRFALTGAHRTVACQQCHVKQQFTGLKFSTCASCHQTPHEKTVPTTCTTCHSNDTWKTRTFDHSRTAFPLVDKHALVDCAGCHKSPAAKVKPASSTCATCHSDPHKGEFKQDCSACHSEKGFEGAAFDHARVAGFALAGGHAAVACTTCHRTVALAGVPLARKSADFRGLKSACASCHVDPHQGELGSSCESCHSPRSFRVTEFTHPRSPDLFTGQHTSLDCKACHKPTAVIAGSRTGTVPAFKSTSSDCASCHRDVHLGQVGSDCQSCHSLNAAKFAPDRFEHDRAPYLLTGRHTALPCTACHKTETGAFPSGPGTALRLTGVATTCASCHADVHLGQVGSSCETCHTTSAFKVDTYTHRNPSKDFFVGRHTTAACLACHKPTTGEFPAGRGTALKFTVGTQCVSCHVDVHRGALGRDCGACHKPEPLLPAHVVRSEVLS